MKYVLSVLLLFTSLAFAATEHWVRIGSYTSATGGALLVSMDDANLIVDGQFNGFVAKGEFDQSFKGKYSTMFGVWEINCHTQETRTRNTQGITPTGEIVSITGGDWRVEPTDVVSVDVLKAVKDRVCFTAS